ncbi:MAG: hypothetical protein U0354_18365 [Candidatus Sericytochromatia bacterium]
MKLNNKLVKISFLALFSLYSCSIENVYNQNLVKNQNISNKYNVKGIVQFDSFKVKNEGEIVRKATVSIIYPSDYTDLSLRNTTLATGLTDNNGAFNINQPQGYVPELNKVMILEASKRVNGVGNSMSTLRTHIKWNGTSWDSITTPTNYINSKTTSLALISALDSNIITPDQTINRIAYNNGEFTVTYDTKLTEGIFGWMLNLVASLVYNYKDPAQEIFALGFDGKAYSFSMIEKTKENMLRYSTLLATYSVDWSGGYPETTEKLEQEAKSKMYWNNLKNPFAEFETISQTLPSAMNYNDYQQAKTTLNYKGITLQNKADLKGIILYIPHKYNTNSSFFDMSYLYAVDIFGELMKVNTKTNSSVYYLTNY